MWISATVPKKSRVEMDSYWQNQPPQIGKTIKTTGCCRIDKFEDERHLGKKKTLKWELFHINQNPQTIGASNFSIIKWKYAINYKARNCKTLKGSWQGRRLN